MIAYQIKNQVLEDKFSAILNRDFDNDFEVAVTHFLSLLDDSKAQDSDVYRHLKLKILEEYPDLENRGKKEIEEDFDRISQKIAENMSYQTVDEFIKAMRREDRL